MRVGFLGQAFEALVVSGRPLLGDVVCPGFPEGTIYQARSPQGFYAGLMRGEVPGWLKPVPLKTGMTLPYTLYRIDYSAPGEKKIPE